jgi:hypothetical protein
VTEINNKAMNLQKEISNRPGRLLKQKLILSWDENLDLMAIPESRIR